MALTATWTQRHGYAPSDPYAGWVQTKPDTTEVGTIVGFVVRGDVTRAVILKGDRLIDMDIDDVIVAQEEDHVPVPG